MATDVGNGGARRGALWRIAGWSVAGLILLTPLVAMQFTDEVNWTVSDFVFMGVLVGGVGLAFELAIRKSDHLAYRVGAAVALAAVFFLVWINAAVGVIGDDEGVNLLYGLVLLVALLGAVAGRFRPMGMARAMVAAAVAQVAVPLVAWALVPGAGPLVWSPEVPVATAFFAAMWLVSAGLFRNAA